MTFILWLSFIPGRWISIELPMPSKEACHKAVLELKLAPRPLEWVAKCEVTQ